jgi:hypothetical protein
MAHVLVDVPHDGHSRACGAAGDHVQLETIGVDDVGCDLVEQRRKRAAIGPKRAHGIE